MHIDSPPLDLRVTQNSLRENKRVEKEEKTHSFFHELIERKELRAFIEKRKTKLQAKGECRITTKIGHNFLGKCMHKN